MSNRRITTLARANRAYRARYAKPSHGFATLQVHRIDGDLSRSEGSRNYAYGPGVGAKKGLHALYKSLARKRRTYGDLHARDAEKRPLLEAMTRDELRAVCKAQNVVGYGKMNKAQLIEAALA